MPAAYLISAFQDELLAHLRQIDRNEGSFFAEAPLVIDGRSDAEAFRSQLTAAQHARIEQAFEIGDLRYVSQLAQPAYKYARDKVEERHRQLDAAALCELRSFLSDWRREIGRRASQPGKSRQSAFGIDIIMPLTGARLSYDIPSLTGL